MPGIDWIPLVSQTKSLIQAATGDLEGARRTEANFLRECPVVSQVTSVVQLATGDVEGAKETQLRCLGTVSNVANGIPVVGHAKGLVHHAFGDHEGGNQALNSATRSTVVVASGAAAAVATGGLAAIPAGIAAGASYDATATLITGEEQGYIAAIKNVAENPSAGSIIDACAIPVGDGLAGYSGGQMATKVQLKNLESIRATKLQQMEAATTDGAAMQFGREAMAADAKINTIRHGTPHVFHDPKGGTVIPEATNPNSTIPVPGYADKSKEDRGRSKGFSVAAVAADLASSEDGKRYEDAKEKDARQKDDKEKDAQQKDAKKDDAIYNDSYVESIIITDNNRRDAQKKMHERDQQRPEGDIYETYRGTKFTTAETLSDLIENASGDPNRNPDRQPNNNVKECLRQLFSWAWLLLIMPTEFPYTMVAQVNSVYGGYYHSFIRHIDEWKRVIPTDVNRIMERLSPLMKEIRDVAAATNFDDALAARERFIEARKQLATESYNDVQAALAEIQLSMHRFIQDNITFDNYQGRSVNTNGQERLYFRVETPSGTMAMVLCLTDQRFMPTTGDNRPLRMLLTIYFETWTEFKSHGLLETKKEMPKRKK